MWLPWVVAQEMHTSSGFIYTHAGLKRSPPLRVAWELMLILE